MLINRGQNFGAMTLRVAGADLLLNAADHAPDMRVPRHEHENAYVCVVLAGGFELDAGRMHDCPAGSVIAYPAGHVHANRFGPQSGRCLNIHFGDSWSADRSLREWLGEMRHVSIAPTAAPLRRLVREMAANDEAAPLALVSAAIELLSTTMRAAEARAAPRWLQHIVDRIESDLAQAPTLSQLAAEVGAHPAHVSRVLRQACGESIGEYVRRRRIEEAELALRGPQPLAEIAAAAGFADQAHFTRLFKRHFGVSPGARRRAMQRPF